MGQGWFRDDSGMVQRGFREGLGILLACPGLADHPTGAVDMLLSQNEEPSELFNSRWVPWSNS